MISLIVNQSGLLSLNKIREELPQDLFLLYGEL
ncbi:hypothetical protein BH10ACI2_BH10ACI2_05030 [soil metagenome]